ncbi:MAG: hypothetical protein V4754_09515 [Pseudomonadota bacterium]
MQTFSRLSHFMQHDHDGTARADAGAPTSGQPGGEVVSARDATLIAFARVAARHMQQRAAGMGQRIAGLDLARQPGAPRSPAPRAASRLAA